MSTEFILLYILIAGNIIWNIIEYFLKRKKSKIEIVSSPVIELNETAFEPMNDNEFKKNKRSKFKFSMIGLKPGDSITYHGNTAIIKDDDTIIFAGEEMTLSGAAMRVWTNEHDGKRGNQMQGPACWTYNGETLDSIRKRMENEQ